MRRLRSRRGSGLVLSLIALTVLGLLGLTAYRVTRSQVRESVFVVRQAQARTIAESGLEDALYRLSQDTGWRAGFQERPLAGGTCTVALSKDDPPWITSTGYSAPIALLGPAVMTLRARAAYVYVSGALVRTSWDSGTWSSGTMRER